MKKTINFSSVIVLTILIGSLAVSSCKNASDAAATEKNELSFDTLKITDSAKHWWAYNAADIDNDEIADLVFIDNNSTGGYLAYLKGSTTAGSWEKVVIAEETPDGKLFASGDLDCGDVDFDGDMDIIAVEHPGEWADAEAPAKIYVYENPSWEAHFVGVVPGAVKDISLADFNKDKKLDIAILTFDESSLSIFMQEDSYTWNQSFFAHHFGNLHEGMDVGDIDGDSYVDIAADGYVFYNPAEALAKDWEAENVDASWNTQEGDWSRNATKHFVRDIDKDGKAEIFIAHSERAGYPVSWYQKNEEGAWIQTIIKDSLAACHTLQVFDFDLDGDLDVFMGSNQGRAVNLGKTSFDVSIYLNDGDNKSWTPYPISTEGIYNGRVIDFDQDGDMDIFRYPSHEANELFLWVNRSI